MRARLLHRRARCAAILSPLVATVTSMIEIVAEASMCPIFLSSSLTRGLPRRPHRDRRALGRQTRWTAAGMMEAAKGFRRLKAYRLLPILKAALVAHATEHVAWLAMGTPHSQGDQLSTRALSADPAGALFASEARGHRPRGRAI
jgi:hypothetical protein